VANASGLPAAVVRQVPFQPMFGNLHEDGLIAHTFVEYTKTGDPTWPLLLPMVKAAVEAMTAASAQAREHWAAEIDEFVVTGASKRGWTTWLSAAVDDRVKGIVPMVIDMLSLGDHVKLQVASFGRMSEELGDYTSRGIEKLFATPRGRELAEIVDPYAYRDRYTMPKVIALGTNDPYWPLEACSLYYDGLPGPRWVSYCPNAGHGLPMPRVAALVAAMGRHVAGIETLPPIEWRFDEAAAGGADCIVSCATRPERVTLWTAASPTRDFRKARWSSQPVVGAGPEWRVPLAAPRTGYAAGLVELEFAREPVPLVLTSGVRLMTSPG
jgi:PhoPQ-activated pathogenicity-related protein